MKWLLLALLVCALWVCGPAACGAPAEAPDAPDPSGEAAAAPAEAADGEHDHRSHSRPLPAFSGYTLDDRKFDVREMIGRRFLLYFFNPEVEASDAVTRAVVAISALRGRHNFDIVGVATGSTRKKALAYVREHGVDHPVLDDSSAQLARRFGLRSPLAMLGVDAEGYVAFGSLGVEGADAAAVEANLRRQLRLPSLEGVAAEDHPLAPTFRAAVLDGDAPFDLAAQRGQAVVLVFFLHTCPHCHSALQSLKETLERLPEDARPRVVGVEITGRTHAVRELMREMDIDYLPVVFDDDGSIQASYGVFGGVPDIFLIDAEGRIRSRIQGWSDTRDAPLLRMRVARIAGAPVPMLLNTKGYSGSEVCGVCHEKEHATWSFTEHASAFDTLVRHGAEHDGECVSCHVVGYGQTGGFTDPAETPDLEDVGCETCHGRGGPHLSPDFLPAEGYAGVCVTCHDPKHSIGFEYATFRPRISHVENEALLALPPEEKRRLLAERGRPGGDLLRTDVAVVGSEACASCHAEAYETWAASPHAHALESLEAKGKAGADDCLRCHTTGFGRPGGFPAGGDAAAHPDLARVGCESCHGPGGEHVAEGAPKRGTILALTDKCDSCAIAQICGACHDEANDPGFEFEIQDKIRAQRHGGLPLPGEEGAWRSLRDEARVARAFAADGG